MRKLLASSPPAIAATLDTMIERLEQIQLNQTTDDRDWIETIISTEDIEDDLLDEDLADDDDSVTQAEPVGTPNPIRLQTEISELRHLAEWARSIGSDTKTRTLLTALTIGFEQMSRTGAARKALIFTESRRTQEHLKRFLENNGFRGSRTTDLEAMPGFNYTDSL
jgi:hypothetical protein